MKIVKAGIDLGNSMLKGATFVNGTLILKKLPNRIQFTKTAYPKIRKMVMNGQTIYMGAGSLNNNVLKHTRKNLLEQSLVMIHELYPNDTNLRVDLRLGLPPTQFFNDAYLKAFQGLFVTNKEYDFDVNGSAMKVIFNSIEVLVEGYSGFVSIVESITSKQDILSIDVGGGTTDLCSYKYDYEDEMYYPYETDTIQNGVIEFAEEIAMYFNSRENADITSETIDQILRNNLKDIEYKDNKYNLENYMESIRPITDDMLNKTTNKFGSLDRYITIGIGGGYKTFGKMIESNIHNEIVIDEDKQFYANAIGFLLQ